MLTGIVPMRGGSERVPNKNLRSFGGEPLFSHILRALSICEAVKSIVVDTDSDAIEAAVRHLDSSIQVVRRPPHLGRRDASMNDVLAYTLSQVSGEEFIQVHSTSPLLTHMSIDRAVKLWRQAHDSDSAFGVTKLQARLWSSSGLPINHDSSVLLPTQDLEPLFLENSSLYLFTRKSFAQRGNRIGAQPRMIEIPALDAMDIDTEEDFQLIEAIFCARERNR